VRGKELAYKSVLEPVEGTILTVIKKGVEKSNQFDKEDFVK
jgi:dihydroxyacetone kinase-like predicted kinase